MAILHPMRIVFSFLPTVMMPGRRRLGCYPRWVVIWTEGDAAAVRLRDCADGQQKRARHNGDDQFHNRSLLRCSRAAGRRAAKSEAVFRLAKVKCNPLRLRF